MAENDSKRYYWLKLKKDFFQQHQIKVLKSLPNGRLYALIYLELMAESCSHDGELRYSKLLPYDIVTLSAVIDEDKDNVEKAIETLINLELIEILDDGTIFMREVSKLLGSETGSAIRKREYRERLTSNEEVPQIAEGTLSQNCPLEYRDKSIEYRDKSIYIDSPEQNIIFKLPLNVKGSEHVVLKEDLDFYKDLYPNVDVEQEFRKMLGWLDANPKKRKTQSGIKNFINSWLSREQDKGGNYKKSDDSLPTYDKSQNEIISDDEAETILRRIKNVS